MFTQLILLAISGAVEAELVALLETFKDLNGHTKYQELKAALTNSFVLLQSVTDKTKTKIDDTLVAMVLAAIEKAP